MVREFITTPPTHHHNSPRMKRKKRNTKRIKFLKCVSLMWAFCVLIVNICLFVSSSGSFLPASLHQELIKDCTGGLTLRFLMSFCRFLQGTLLSIMKSSISFRDCTHKISLRLLVCILFIIYSINQDRKFSHKKFWSLS